MGGWGGGGEIERVKDRKRAEREYRLILHDIISLYILK